MRARQDGWRAIEQLQSDGCKHQQDMNLRQPFCATQAGLLQACRLQADQAQLICDTEHCSAASLVQLWQARPEFSTHTNREKNTSASPRKKLTQIVILNVATNGHCVAASGLGDQLGPQPNADMSPERQRPSREVTLASTANG
jgi:hypothetical protein